MKTVKIYIVRKPSDIDEVKELCQHYNNQAEEVTVAETVNLPPVWYDAVCRAPLDDYIFLSWQRRLRRRKPPPSSCLKMPWQTNALR